MNVRLIVMLILAVSTGLSGCAGARPHVKFDSARYPVSLSKHVLDRDGSVLGPKDWFPVGRFHAYQRGWAVMYSRLQTNVIDFSNDVNKQVEAAKGEAIVNLQIATGESKCQCINFSQLFQLFPFHPGCVDVFLEGDIVRSRLR